MHSPPHELRICTHGLVFWGQWPGKFEKPSSIRWAPWDPQHVPLLSVSSRWIQGRPQRACPGMPGPAFLRLYPHLPSRGNRRVERRTGGERSFSADFRQLRVWLGLLSHITCGASSLRFSFHGKCVEKGHNGELTQGGEMRGLYFHNCCGPQSPFPLNSAVDMGISFTYGTYIYIYICICIYI